MYTCIWAIGRYYNVCMAHVHIYTLQRSDTKLTQRGLHRMFIYIAYYYILYCTHTSSYAYTHRGVGCDRSCTYIYRFVSIEYSIIRSCAHRLSYAHLYVMYIGIHFN